jgi:hypothetical protein
MSGFRVQKRWWKKVVDIFGWILYSSWYQREEKKAKTRF